MRRLFLPPERIAAGRARLLPGEVHYLRHVLRLTAGARLEIFDGAGGVHSAELPAEGDELRLGPRREAAAAKTRLWLAFAPPRGDRSDVVVEKATELGVERLLPFQAERSVVRLGGRGAARAGRWRRIAAAAARQCGRADVPEVDEPGTLAGVLAATPPGFRVVLLHEAGGEPLAAVVDPGAPGHLALVGPEGGFSRVEAAACVGAGARAATLGPRILRAETAAIAVAALIQHRAGDMG